MYAVISRSDPALPSASVPETPLQRAAGAVELVFRSDGGQTRVERVFQQGSAKLRFPRGAPGDPPEAVILNIAGGMTGGDSQNVSLRLQAGANATFTTQACERIYRSLGSDALMSANIKLDTGATLEWLPQPLILFDGGRLKRETEISMAADAALLSVESVIFGRTSSGERVETGALSDAWFTRRAGRLVQAERFHIDGEIEKNLSLPVVLGSHRAMAVIRYVSPDAVRRLEEMRALLADAEIFAAASTWNGMLVARFLAPDGYGLCKELARVLTAFRKRPMPRAWML